MNRHDILFIFYSCLTDELQLTSLMRFDYQMCSSLALVAKVCKTMTIYCNNDFCSILFVILIKNISLLFALFVSIFGSTSSFFSRKHFFIGLQYASTEFQSFLCWLVNSSCSFSMKH